MAKKLFRLVFYSLIILSALLVALHFIIASPKAQQRILKVVSKELSKELQTNVTVDSVAFIPYGKISIFSINIPTPEEEAFLHLDRVDFSIYSLNFWKKKFHPKSLRMEGVQVNLQRAPYSKQWNYSFLNKHKKTKSKDWNWSFTRGELEIDDLKVIYRDSLNGNDVNIRIPNTQLRFNLWDAIAKNIEVKSIRIDKPEIYVGIFNQSKGDNILMDPITASVEDLIKNYTHTLFNPGLWDIDIAQVKLFEGAFQLRYEERPYDQFLFDYRNIEVENIELEFRTLLVRGDTIETYINKLSGRDRSGLEIKSLKSQLSFSPTKVNFGNLDLETEYSVIKGAYSMSYPNFYAFLDYNNAVYMKGDFEKETKVAWKDLNYFASALTSLNHNVTSLEGKMEGYVNHLKGNDVLVWDGFSTVNTDVDIKGLPETEITIYTFENIKLQSNAMGLSYYLPNLDMQDYAAYFSKIEAAGDLKFSDQFLDFELFANTNQGKLSALFDIEYPFDALRRQLTEGNIELERMQIGYLFENEQNIQLTGKVDLFENLNNPTSKYHVNSLWSQVLWDDKNFEAVHFNAQGDFDLWNGQLAFKNPFGSLKSNIKYAKNEERHLWEIDQELNNFKVSQFGGLMNDSKANISGKWKAEILQTPSETNAQVETVYLMNNKNGSFYHPFTFAYFKQPQSSVLELQSKDIDLKLTGQWNWSTLFEFPKYIQEEVLKSSGSGYFAAEKKDNFDLLLMYQNSDSLISDLIPSFKTNGQQIVQVSFDGLEEKMTWNATLPFLQWQSISFNQLRSIGTFNHQVLTSETTADYVGFNHIEWLKDLELKGNSNQNGMLFSLSSEGSELISSLNMQALFSSTENGYELKFLPSTFKVNSETWHFPYTASDYHIRFSEGDLTFNKLVFESEKQRFNIETTHGLEESSHHVRLRNLNLNLLNGFIEASNYEIQGNLNGELVFQNQINKDPLLYFDLVGHDLSVQKHPLAFLKTSGYIDLKQQFIHWDEHKMSDKESELLWSGNFQWNDRNNHDLDISMVNLPIVWSEIFLKNVLNNLDGHLSGELNLKGNYAQPIWNGNIVADSVQFKPVVTGVLYTIPEATVTVKNNLWEIPSTQIQDKNNWVAEGSGYLKSESWSQWHLSIQAQSEKIQILDLGVNDQQYYYGDINGKAFFSLAGPFEHLVVRVNASPLSNSKLFIPVHDETNIQQYSYIQFKQLSPNVAQSTKNDRIDFYLQTSVDPDLEITLILDEVLKDKITARGNGYIQMSSNAQNPLKMNGTYIIDQGTYDFVFRQLEIINFRKKFIIQSNSVIKWDGDPWNALLDVKGYALVKARLYDLISSEADRMNLSNQEIRDAQTPQPILVNLEMNGFLNEPVFDFSLALEEGRSLGTLAYQKLQRINQDARMLVNQVGSLLLLEQFVPNEGLTNVNLASGSINNMTEIVSSAASNQITNFANKVLGMEDLVIGVKYKNYNFSDPQDLREMQHLNRNEAGIQVRKNFLSNRLMVEVGGSYDWGRVETQKYTTDFMGDFRIQYFITEDGKIRLNAFRNSQYDVLYGKTVSRQGVGIGYKKSFNNFHFFKKDSTQYETKETPVKDSLSVLEKSTKKSI